MTETLGVDPPALTRYGTDLLNSANEIPPPPEPFVVDGQDAISTAIAEKLPGLEEPILRGLP